jgi:hypothetical protein
VPVPVPVPVPVTYPHKPIKAQYRIRYYQQRKSTIAMLSGPCPSLGPGGVATGKSMSGHVFATLSFSSGEQLVSRARPCKIGPCHHCATGDSITA